MYNTHTHTLVLYVLCVRAYVGFLLLLLLLVCSVHEVKVLAREFRSREESFTCEPNVTLLVSNCVTRVASVADIRIAHGRRVCKVQIQRCLAHDNETCVSVLVVWNVETTEHRENGMGGEFPLVQILVLCPVVARAEGLVRLFVSSTGNNLFIFIFVLILVIVSLHLCVGVCDAGFAPVV